MEAAKDTRSKGGGAGKAVFKQLSYSIAAGVQTTEKAFKTLKVNGDTAMGICYNLLQANEARQYSFLH